MFCFDFFNTDTLWDVFCRFYNIDREFAKPLITAAVQQKNPVLFFLRQTKLTLDRISVEGVFLRCRHITTTHDSLESLSRYGLLTLNDALSKGTDLRNFLTENKVEVDVEHMIFTFNGQSIYLHDYSSDCLECYYGECKYQKYQWNGNVDIEYKNDMCNFREMTRSLSLKLYHCKGEIEVHLAGDTHAMHNYSCVKRWPEILETINKLINDIYKENLALTSKWEKQHNKKYYCLSFDVNIKDFEYITAGKKYEKQYYYSYLDFCQNQYNDLPEGDKNFYGNVYLLSNSISTLAGNRITDYGAILPSVQIPYESLSIEQFNL